MTRLETIFLHAGRTAKVNAKALCLSREEGRGYPPEMRHLSPFAIKHMNLKTNS